jgi:hypothetical protein
VLCEEIVGPHELIEIFAHAPQFVIFAARHSFVDQIDHQRFELRHHLWITRMQAVGVAVKNERIADIAEAFELRPVFNR